MTRADYDRLIEVLRSARSRKHMYFLPVTPVAAIHWLHGLRTGFAFAGLEWKAAHRESAVKQRGLTFRTAAWEAEELESCGLNPDEVVSELLSIEIEMWQSQRDEFVSRVEPLGATMMEPTGLLPFIPGGSDFLQSRRLFLELGFEETSDNGSYVGFRHGAARFILQDFNDSTFASNLMLVIEVPDLDAWWAVVESKRLPENFPGVRIKPPTDFPWGREVHLIDLAGVCWHVRKR